MRNSQHSLYSSPDLAAPPANIYTRIAKSSKSDEHSDKGFHFDPAEPNLRELDLNGDFSPSEWNELAWVRGIGSLQHGDRVYASSINNVRSSIALPNNLHYVPAA
jgi:hypothetical protein